MNLPVLKRLYGKLLLAGLVSRNRNSGARFTCQRKETAGIGNYLLSYFSTISFCEYMGFEYIHTPLSAIGHNYSDEENFATLWEKQSGLELLTGSAPRVEEKTPLTDIQTDLFGLEPIDQEQVTVITNCFQYWFLDPGAMEKFVPRVRDCYERSAPHNRVKLGEPGVVHIAVHARRGDVGEQENAYLYTPTNAYQALVGHLQKCFRERDVKIHLFSQGEPASWKPLENMGVQLHLDEDPFDSFSRYGQCRYTCRQQEHLQHHRRDDVSWNHIVSPRGVALPHKLDRNQ